MLRKYSSHALRAAMINIQKDEAKAYIFGFQEGEQIYIGLKDCYAIRAFSRLLFEPVDRVERYAVVTL